MHLSIRIISYILMSVLLSYDAYAQSSFRATTYNKDNGMPSELIKSTAIDKHGFLWLATDEGLVRFNGHKFKYYREELPSPYVKSILLSKSGKLLATTDLGFIEITTEVNSASFRTIIEGRTSNTDSLLWFPKLLFEDKKGDIWFSDNTAIYYYNHERVRRIILPEKNHSYNWQRACSFAEGEMDNLLVFSEPGYVYSYNYATEDLTEVAIEAPLGTINHALKIGVAEYIISAGKKTFIASIKDSVDVSYTKENTDYSYFLMYGDVVLAASWSDGIHIVEKNANFAHRKIQGYHFQSANFIFSNNAKQVWCSSDNGVVLLQPEVFSSYFQKYTKQYIQDFEAKNGNCYFTNGTDVFLVDSNFKTTKILSTPKSTTIQILPTTNGVWCANNKAQLNLWEEGRLKKQVDLSDLGGTCFSLTEHNGFWLCQDGNSSLVYVGESERKQYGNTKGLTGRPVTSVVGADGNLYVGAQGDTSYFFVFDKEQDRFVNLSVPISEEHSDAVILNDIAFDSEQECIWLGTSIGLYKYKNRAIQQTKVGQEKQNAVKALSFDKATGLWLANSKGLSMLKDSNTVVFDERAGLPSKTIAYRVLKRGDDGRIWVGTAAGLGVSNTLEPSKTTPTPKFLTILNNRDTVQAESQRSFLTSSYFRIEFISPIFPSQTVRYQWRIKEENSVWKEESHYNNIEFNNMKVGSYTLQLRAVQTGNFIWSTPAQFEFEIHLPWYKTLAFWLSFLAALLGIIVLVVRINTNRLKQEKKNLEELVNIRTREILNSKDKIKASEQQLLASKIELQDTLYVLETTNNYLHSQTLALNTSSIVSMSDSDGYITFANDNFVRLSGYTRSELIGDTHRILKSDVHSDAFFQELWSTIQTEKWRGEICNRKKNGELYWVDTSIVPFMDDNGHVYQFLSIRFDITHQKLTQRVLEKKNREIFEGIQYASVIQKILMPPFQALHDQFKDFFIFYQPRDVISGDFYWTKRIDNKILFAVADCTGHGVPGAMVSMLGMAFMNEISNLQVDPNSGLFLENLRELVKASLHQKDFQSGQNDGMDLALCIYDTETNVLQFSGANLPLYMVHQGELTELVGTPNPISYYRKEMSFKVHELLLPPGATLYMFSDGFVDQFGGDNDQKYMTRRFKNLLTSISTLPMQEQQLAIHKEFIAWKGSQKQIDDVLIMGFCFDPIPNNIEQNDS